MSTLTDAPTDTTYAVWTGGDPDTNIPGERADVTLYGTEDDAEARARLAATFAAIWGVKTPDVHVMSTAEMSEPE